MEDTQSAQSGNFKSFVFCLYFVGVFVKIGVKLGFGFVCFRKASSVCAPIGV